MKKKPRIITSSIGGITEAKSFNYFEKFKHNRPLVQSVLEYPRRFKNREEPHWLRAQGIRVAVHSRHFVFRSFLKDYKVIFTELLSL